MTRFLPIALTAATLVLGATAATAGEPATFKLDGRTYTYTTTTTKDGAVVFTGQAEPGNDFRFVVRGNQVTGEVDNAPVSFTVAESRGAARRAVPGTPVLRTAATVPGTVAND
jgi:hypothetical protein